jgi:Caspase domain
MKNSLSRILAFAAMFVFATAWTQASENIFDPKVSVTWLGLDFSKAKFVGPSIDFGTPEKQVALMSAWNNTLSKEQEKYSIRQFFRKQTVNLDFSLTDTNNESLKFSSMLVDKIDEKQPGLAQSDIQEIINGYDFSGRRGLGLMFNVESFNRNNAKCAIWVTFINLSSQEVIFTERRIGEPGGAGAKNFWANSVLNMMERISRKEFETWKAGNHTISPNAVASSSREQKRKVQREALVPNATTPQTGNDSEAKVSATLAVSNSVKPGGKYFALLIGVSQYMDDRLNLDNPVNDAKKIKKVLTESYNFEPQNAILLENPTRGEIFSALYKLRNEITSNDNLLIFYAGHGYWDEKIRQGYWWPRDANASDPSNWLSNSDLREQLRGISSAHTLLVSDACFSGGLFRTRDPSMKMASMDYQMLYKLPSRRAITSGTLTAVPDNSVFVEYFLKRLSQNSEQFLPSQQLFNTIRLAIINNSATVPQEGVIAETGDEGGDFIFLKKE